MKTTTLGLALVIVGGILMIPILVNPAPLSAHEHRFQTDRPS
jgi:hypothetical protein